MAKKKISYTEEDIKDCIHMIKSTNAKIKKAARIFKIPATTIRDRLFGKSDPSNKPGPSKLLTDNEETSLAYYVQYMSDIGLGLTGKMLCLFALSIIQERDPSKRLPPKKDWARKFLKRHKLSFRKASHLSTQRVCSSCVQAVDDYFEKLEKVYDELKLHDRPEAIWNMDESYFGKNQEGMNRRTIGKRGGQCPKQQQVFSADHTTIACCINAAGWYMSNLLIFTKCLPSERYKALSPNDWLMGWSETGYINTDMFEQWFEKVFVAQCGSSPDKPVLLLMDNCSTHYSLKVLKMAKENNIHILCEPPHTSHLLQPLDKIFYNLKDEFSKRCYASKVVDANASVKKGNMAVKIKEARNIPGALELLKVLLTG